MNQRIPADVLAGLALFAWAIALLTILAACVGGVVGGVWLAIRGEWRSLLVGLALGAVMPFAHLFVERGVAPLARGLKRAVERGRTMLAVLIAGSAGLYLGAVLTACPLAAFLAVATGRGTSVLHLLWALGVTMPPLAYALFRGPGCRLDLTNGLRLLVPSLAALLIGTGMLCEWRPRTFAWSLVALVVAYGAFVAVLASRPPSVRTYRV